MKRLFTACTGCIVVVSASPEEASWGSRGIATFFLQDLDDSLCDKISTLFGFSPFVGGSCSRKSSQPHDDFASSPLAPFQRRRTIPSRNCSAVESMLRKERNSSKLKQRQLRALQSQMQRSKKQISILAAEKQDSAEQLQQAKVESAELVSKMESLQREVEQTIAQLAMQSRTVDELNLQHMQKLTECKANLEEADALHRRNASSPTSTPIVVPVCFESFTRLCLLCLVFALFGGSLVGWRLRAAGEQFRRERDDMQSQLQEKTSELLDSLASISSPDKQSKLSTDDDSDSHSDTVEFDFLDADFSFQTFDEKAGQDSLRIIKIKCPGVHRDDVLIDVLCDGCIVTIDRKSSHGVGAAEWVKHFQFNSLRRYDLMDDKISLDGGFLTLCFQPFRGRVFRFPQHFDMSLEDSEDSWLYCDDRPVCRSVDPNIEKASQALRMAAAAYGGQNVAVITDDSS